jgi:tRNA(His) 5'-end guanylyltransferase
MNFKSLKEKGEYYRSLTDYRLLPNSYAVIMLDGRSFSHKIKNKFKKPFDDDFVRMMNETTKYLCENIQGALCGYCQSDEIHIVISDFVKHFITKEDGIYHDDENTSSSAFFTYRVSKIQSIVASMATSKFNNLMTQYKLQNAITENASAEDLRKYTIGTVANMPLYEFDCKVWNVPNAHDVYAWLLYRQFDCIRNSKQQLAQTYVPHNVLSGKNADKQIELLAQEKGIDWNDFPDGLKNGRIVYKAEMLFTNQDGIPYIRSKWLVEPAKRFDNLDDINVNIRDVIDGRIYEYANNKN